MRMRITTDTESGDACVEQGGRIVAAAGGVVAEEALRSCALVNLAAVERNVASVVARLAPGTTLCAVVKADGYGHGAVPVAGAALAGGARHLAVVTSSEAVTLRQAGVDAPLIVLGSLRGAEVDAVLAAGAETVISTTTELAALQQRRRPARVHVKLDTGMNRLGALDVDEALDLCARVKETPTLTLAGAMTHFATADEPGGAAFRRQLERFTVFAARVRSLDRQARVHAANSAATLAEPAAHFDMVRTGVAIYGLDPFGRDPHEHGLEPALSWHARVAAVKPLSAGGAVGYGRQFVAPRNTRVATVAIGYGDGVRRALGDAEPPATVLIGGHRRPLIGRVSMDSFAVDLGPAGVAQPGDRVTILGADGEERVTAEQLATHLRTINYEVVCGISARIPRRYHRDGAPWPDPDPHPEDR
jgi:alanine racemase